MTLLRDLAIWRSRPRSPDPPEPPRHSVDARPGVIAAVVVLCLFGGLGLSVDFPRAAGGFTSDESTYYVMAHSLADDGDLTYRREDLQRVWKEFPSGPTGIFLKRGRAISVTMDLRPPFVHVASSADPDRTRLYFGKSYAYPLFAAPWLVVFGTNGFLVFHALLLALVVFCGYLFLNARSSPAVALLLSSAFVFASVAAAYGVWMTPELFNFAFVALACFCWLYKDVSDPATTPRGARWLLGPGSDALGAALLAFAAFSKPPNALLLAPVVLWQLRQRRWRSAAFSVAVFCVLGAALFGINMAVAGEWNFQGGDRRTFYTAFPFLPGGATFDMGADKATDRILYDIIFDPKVFWTVLGHNLWYFLVGRHSGLVPYFFPAVFSAIALALARGRRRLWQVLLLATVGVEVLVLVVWIPYDYFGGGGVLGNRYFMNWYGVFLFLLPPIRSAALAAIPWVVGGLFTAQITFNPFYSSFHPAEHEMHGPLRWLPVELTLLNNLPITTSPSQVRVPFGSGDDAFQLYFLDGNVYAPKPANPDPRDEPGSFWVKGESTTELVLRCRPGVRRLVLRLISGDVANQVTVSAGGRTREVALPPRGAAHATIPLAGGFPYQGSLVWTVSITSGSGFVPMFSSGGPDYRFLGVRVTPEVTRD
jgi:hypothetical protein